MFLRGNGVFGSVSPSQNAVQESLSFMKILKYFGLRYVFAVKERKMFSFNIIIWSFMLYIVLFQCTA